MMLTCKIHDDRDPAGQCSCSEIVEQLRTQRDACLRLIATAETIIEEVAACRTSAR